MAEIIEYGYRFNQYADTTDQSCICQKNSNIAIAILAYNQLDAVKRLSKFWYDASLRLNIDILFIDNSSTDGTFEYLYAEYKDKFSIIKLKANYGGAGGFAYAQEHVIAHGYEYCMLTEEDAFPLDNDIVDEMLKYAAPNARVCAKFYELNVPSFSLHFNLYPVALFKEAGVMNSNLFFRKDDLEYEYRIKKAMDKLGIKTVVVDKYYTHMIQKAGFGVGSNYFELRNDLAVSSAYFGLKALGHMLKISLIFLVNAFFAILYDKNCALLTEFCYSIYDFLVGSYVNLKRIRQFSPNTLKPHDSFELKQYSFAEFFEKYANYKIYSDRIKNNHIVRNYIGSRLNDKCSNKFYGIISAKFNGIKRIGAFWYKYIIFIEELDIKNIKLSAICLTNEKLFKTRLLLIAAYLSAFCFMPLLLIIFLVKCIFNYKSYGFLGLLNK